MKTKVLEVLNSVLPKKTYIKVVEAVSWTKEPYLKILIAMSDKEINNVRMQHPQLVSLALELETLELRTQVFGGCGGQSIYRMVDKNHPKECYLAMKNIKIPFRKPKNTETAVLKAIQRFAERYIQTLKENQSRLMYQDIVNYSEILK